MEAQRFILRLTLSVIAVVAIVQLQCGSCFGQRASASGEAETGSHLKADAKRTSTPLVHFWSKVVGAGRANEGLRATWQEELATAGKYDGFQYIRFHGIFHDDMWVYREDNSGKPIYNFQYIDDLYDRMLEKGIRPFVELGFSPGEIARVKNTTFWWHPNGSPPTDYNKWADLVQAFVEHCVARYGIDEVRQWYFEVWNEPNLYESFFRGGSQAQYFELYKITALTIKKIDSQEEAFYTIDRSTGKKVYVGVVRGDGNKVPYLRTHADGKWKDNLLALDECSSICKIIG